MAAAAMATVGGVVPCTPPYTMGVDPTSPPRGRGGGLLGECSTVAAMTGGSHAVAAGTGGATAAPPAPAPAAVGTHTVAVDAAADKDCAHAADANTAAPLVVFSALLVMFSCATCCC